MSELHPGIAYGITPAVFEPTLQERQPVATRLLSSALQRQALSNAYLFTGRAVADKWLLAQRLAAFLNCLSRKENEYFSCLTTSGSNLNIGSHFNNSGKCSGVPEIVLETYCQNCRWIATGEHPQAWLVLEGQGESGKIPVEKARLLTDEMAKTSRYMRVVIIPQADQNCLHAAPANALLKNIEEPQDNALFLLFAASSEQVLPTIVSRSQLIPLQNEFKSGLWIEELGYSDPELKLSEKLSSIKSEFIHNARKRLSGTSSLHGSFLKAVSESHDLSQRLLSLSEEEDIEADQLIDVLLAAELEVLRGPACNYQNVSLYLSRLAVLCESAKQQLNHYVRKNNVLETFAYSLTELRSKYLGDFSLAKN